MNFRIMVTALLACVLAAPTVRGQSLAKTGTTAAAFLKMGVGPRAIGMGGAFTATANDLSSAYWNPGGLASIYNREAMFNHTRWFADVNYDYAGFAIGIPDFGTLSASVAVVSKDEMAVRTEEEPTGTGEMFDAGDLAIGLSYARNLTDQFSMGFTAKYIRQHIWHESAIGMAIDVGALYRIPVLNELRIGVSVSNFGTKMQMEGRDQLVITQVGAGGGNQVNTALELEEYDLPLLFRFGVAVDAIKTSSARVTAAVDAVHPNDNTELVNTGVEFAWNDILFLRGGYKSLFERDTEQGLTLGVGLHYSLTDMVRVKVDYAYQDFGRLTNVQYFALAVEF
jgi:hypothetical protein